MEAPHIQADLVSWRDGLRRNLQCLSPAIYNMRRMAVIAMLDRWRLIPAPLNGFNRFCSLPSPVLHSILERLEPFDYLSLSQTCRQLHRYVQDHAELWNDLSGIMYSPLRRNLDPLQCVETLVERASPGPLQLTIPVDVWDVKKRDKAFEIAEMHLSRLSYLSLTLSLVHINRDDQAIVHAEALRCLAACLSGAAPVLDSINIYICEDCCLAPLPLDAGIFNGTAPNLTKCSLENVSLSANRYLAWSNLITLSYAPRSSDIDVLVFNQLLLSCPRLENLALYVNRFETAGSLSGDTPRPHAALRDILVDWVDEGFHDLLTHLMHLPMRNMVLPSQPTLEEWNRFLSHFAVSRLALGIAVCEADALHIETSRYVRVRFAMNRIFVVYHALHVQATYSHVTSLALHEFFWPRDVSFPEAPSITSLRIMLASCKHIERRTWTASSKCGIFQATLETAWSLPSLREFHLTYWLSDRCWKPQTACCCSTRISLSLSDVHHFVASCLRFPAARLSNITLSGVEVIDLLPGPWLERLGDLAEDVIFSPSSTPTSADASSHVWDGKFEDTFRECLSDVC